MSTDDLLEPPAFATDADDRALSALARSVPMRGSIAYVLEREPSFLAMSRAQGDGTRVVVLREREGGRIVASGMGAPTRVFLNGAEREIVYAGDLKVRPDYRRKGVAGVVLRAAIEAFSDQDLAFGSVLRDNDAVLRFFGASADLVRLHPVADVANYTVFFGRARRTSGVRRAEPADAGAMVELFARVQRGRQLAPVLDRANPVEALTRWPGMQLSDYFVLERGGRVVAFAGVWDAFAVKQVRLLSLSPALSAVRVGYNALARALGRPRLPRDGAHLRFVYVTTVCAEDADDLGVVLRGIEAAFGHGEHVYFDMAFDERDPLVRALDGFLKSKVGFRVSLLTWGKNLDRPPALDGRPVYFDAAIV